MTQSGTRELPAELTRYTLSPEWERAEADARRRQRALEELTEAKRRSKR